MSRALVPICLFCAAALVSPLTGCKKSEPAPAAPAAGPAKGQPAAAPGADKAAAGDPTTKAADPKLAAGDTPVADPHKGVTPAAGDSAKRIEGPVAKVNGVPLPSDEFYAELDKITARGAKIPPDRMSRIEQNILKRLIEKELVRQAVEQGGINVEKAEVDAAFEEYKKRFQTEEQFQNYLKHGRVTVESIRDRISEKKALEKLIDSRGNMAISDEEAKEFYTKNERFYLEKAGVRASHVLVKLPEKATPEQETAAKEKIKTVQAELKAGKDFAEVAKQHSEGPSAPKGGDLGFFGTGQMVKAFEEKAFAMKKGEVSESVRTRFGLHIIKVIDKREERKKTFEEVKEQIEQSLKNKKFFQERRKLLEELQKNAKIDKMLPDPPPAAPGAAAKPGADPHAAPGAAAKPAAAAAKPAAAARPAPAGDAAPKAE